MTNNHPFEFHTNCLFDERSFTSLMRLPCPVEAGAMTPEAFRDLLESVDGPRSHVGFLYEEPSGRRRLCVVEGIDAAVREYQANCGNWGVRLIGAADPAMIQEADTVTRMKLLIVAIGSDRWPA